MSLTQQHATKIAGIRSLFARQAGLALPEPSVVLEGTPHEYRRVCRLAIKYDKKARCARLGFRRRQSSELVEVDVCPVLVSTLSRLIPPLRTLCNQLRSYRDLGHVELCQTAARPLVLLRHNGSPGERDLALLHDFATREGVDFYLQTEGAPQPLSVQAAPTYRVDDVEIGFLPGDFLQVNGTVNEALVTTVLEWLAPGEHDRVLDLFCGLGNFTLPLARRCARVVGIEGVADMVHRARENALANGLDNVRFYHSDLSADFTGEPWAKEGFDLVLLDPARAGALPVMSHLCRLAPKRILYVSCNPVTAARDCKPLQEAGYQLRRWGMLDMFPHTGHVESILLFESTEQ